MRNEKMSYLIRIVAGGYLIYLAYKLFQGSIITGEMTGGKKALGIAACLLFVVAGAFFVVTSLRRLMLLSQASPEELEDQGEALEENQEGQENQGEALEENQEDQENQGETRKEDPGELIEEENPEKAGEDQRGEADGEEK